MTTDRSLIAFAAVLVLAAVSAFVACGTGQDVCAAADPWDEYPDADYIITSDSRGTFVHSWTQSEDGSDRVWSSERFSRGSDIELVKWSECGDSISVVVDGAEIGDLTIVGMDDVAISTKYIDVEFTMHSGSIGRFMIIDAPSAQSSLLGDDYYNVLTAVRSADITFRGGHVTSFVPTADLIRVESMDVRIRGGATVDRFLTTGENGSYGSVSVTLEGGNVGYMSNVRSKIGNIDYSFEAGAVDYFCIGSNSQYSTSDSLSGQSVSYISGDVTVYMSGIVRNKASVIGGGVIDAPNFFSNGQDVHPSAVKNVTIEAEGFTFHADTCFLTENRNFAFQFSSYRFGTSVYSGPIDTFCYDSDGSQIQLYDSAGVWSSMSGFGIGSGISLFSNCILVLHAGSEIDIEQGGRFVSTDKIKLHGDIVNNGAFTNSAVIEKHEGSVSGTVGGDGLIADHITFPGDSSNISVMSSDDTVAVELESDGFVESISAVLCNGDRNISITAPKDIGFRGTYYLISLMEMSVSEGFDAGFNLRVVGIDSRILEVCSVSVTVPVSGIPSGYVGEVYFYDEEQGKYIQVEVTGSTAKSLTFDTSYSGYYQIRYVPADASDAVSGDDNHLEVALLLMGIAAVGLMMVYVVFKRR